MKISRHKNIEIRFDPSNHTYTDDSGRRYKSVTSFISGFFPKFDSDTISKKVSVRDGVPQDEILKKWEDKRNKAANEGTMIHSMIEDHILGLEGQYNEPSDAVLKKANNGIKYYQNMIKHGMTLVETEKIVFSPSMGVAGTIDLLMYEPHGKTMDIIDWKSNEKIEFTNHWRTGLAALSHLDDCSYNKYAIQLNTYKYILQSEGYYDNVDEWQMTLVHLTEDLASEITVFSKTRDIIKMIGVKDG